MEHRKISGAKETKTMRRNLGGNEPSKIGTPSSISRHDGQLDTKNEPSKTHPAQASTQTRRPISYRALEKKPIFNATCHYYNRCGELQP